MNKTLLVIAAIVPTFVAPSHAASKDHFETRICRGCDYNHALATARELKPAITCTGATNPTDPGAFGAQACYATPVNVLVVNADNRQMWRFENTYSNQGQPHYNLKNEVNPIAGIPVDAIALMHQLLDDYHQLHLWVKQMEQQLTAERDAGRAAKGDECNSGDYGKALDLAFSPQKISQLQLTFQSWGKSQPSFLQNLQDAKLTGYSFSVSNTGASAGGTWQNSAEPLTIKTVYNSDNGHTQVAINVSVVSHSIVASLNEYETYFDGLALNHIKGISASSSLISKCLADKLDDMYPKTVAGAASSAPSMNNVPLKSNLSGTGTGGGGRGQTCKHTYYINGVEVISFEGECP